MSSLVPGPIFITTGLNRNSTPTPPNTTPAQLDTKYRRIDYNGHDWPCDSPVSRAYDVANTSTKLIILNNKYGKNGTRLRGYYTGPKKPERHVDPNRHRAESPRNPRFHTSCLDSSSPKFEPTIKTELEWINSSHRPPNALIGALLSLSDDHCSELDLPVSIGKGDEKADTVSILSRKADTLSILSRKADTVSINLSSVFDMPLEEPVTVVKQKKRPLHQAKHSVNPRRHATCLSPSNLPAYDDRPRSRMSLPPNKYFTNSEFANMSMGEKIYMWSIEKIYNMDKMKQLKQEQYRKLLEMEAKKGQHGYREYTKYMRYINSAKDRSYGTETPSDKRSRSAHSPRSQRSKSATSRKSPTKSETRSEEDMDNEKQDQTERPKTSLGHSREEPLNDSKPPAGDTKKSTSSLGSDGHKSLGSQKSLQKSPSPSRKSSAKSSRSNSQRSLRSKSESRASSAYSAKSVGKSKGDHSDSSLTNGDDDVPLLHREGKDRPKSRLGYPRPDGKDQSNEEREVNLPKEEKEDEVLHFEGIDRPKSRLGHPGAQTTDQDSLHSSSLSIKSDNTSLSSDSGVENGKKGKKTKQSSDTSSVSSVDNFNRKNNRDRRRKNKQQFVETKQNKKMGSRSSVSSKSSSRSDNDSKKNANQNKGNKSNEKLDMKGKTEQAVKDKSPDKDAKVHRIPSATFAEEETANAEKNHEKTDDEKVKELEKDKSDQQKENTEQTTSNVEENKEEDNKKDQSDSIKQGDETEAVVPEKKSDNNTNDKPLESENKPVEETKNKSLEPVEETENKPDEKTEKADVPAEEQHDQGKPDENKEDKTESKTEAKEETAEKQDGTGEEKEDTGKNKLSRQDSIEEEDEDRKVNKDLDKIEY
ncbi:titin homolog isoform X1 [Mercenaria mercenaria]|uniref:titin homolog isoform X1 n=1 Tax=Mercenaria mercenaria TaxID=6596 RepID=UPI00234F7AA3|nr:titin homolog isoform X1 [Mercenaria mercenaria]XP_045173555.2 titin homolog isoform X1 [Mercenaria mercenaria]XP_045173556.2 titin homolog isoform X1 [Mercenaria mercenaria]XP_045173559.2 titin homolog isoform X1 [Mercenaria mercenaria]